MIAIVGVVCLYRRKLKKSTNQTINNININLDVLSAGKQRKCTSNLPQGMKTEEIGEVDNDNSLSRRSEGNAKPHLEREVTDYI